MKRRSGADPSPRPAKRRRLRLKSRKLPILPEGICPPTADAVESLPSSSHPTGKTWRLRSISAPAKLFPQPRNENNPLVHLDATKSDVKFADPWPIPILKFKGGIAELERPRVHKVQVTDPPDDPVVIAVGILSILIPCACVVIYRDGDHDLLTSCWKFLKCFAIAQVIGALVICCYCVWIGHPILADAPVFPLGVVSKAVVDKTTVLLEDIRKADEVKWMEVDSDLAKRTEEEKGGPLDVTEEYHYVTDLNLSIPGSFHTT